MVTKVFSRVLGPVIAAVGCLVLLVNPELNMVMAQENASEWTFDQTNDPQNQGRSTAILSFGRPGTSPGQLIAICAAGAGGELPVVNLVADVGDLAEGAKTSLRFSGGGEELTREGYVSRAKLATDITGLRLIMGTDDPLWSLMRRLGSISYQVPGYSAETLGLNGADDKLTGFLEACRNYASPAAAVPGATSASQDTSTDEKEAFEAAKQLATPEGWQAFLKNFSTGFRADLARAFLQQAQSGVNLGNTPPAQTPMFQTVNLGPGPVPWESAFALNLHDGTAERLAAGVVANGVGLAAYCTATGRVGIIVREVIKGVYPDFVGRMNQGIQAALDPMAPGQDIANITMRFDGGREYVLDASFSSQTSDLSLLKIAGIPSGQGFPADGPIVQDIMSRNAMTISAPPFEATLQLNGSRAAMCEMLKICGLDAFAGCVRPQRAANPPAGNTSPCGAGKVLLEGQCIANSQVQSFCGPGFHRQGSKCVSNANSANAGSPPACAPGLILEDLGGGQWHCAEDD